MPKQVQISAEVAAVLARATVEANVIKLPPGQLERGLYVDVDKVLKALGGKWDRRAGGHVFAQGIGDQLASALAAGWAVDRKRTIELFETPPDVALRMAQMAAGVSDLIEGPVRMLEPEAGRGRLLAAWQENIEVNGRDEILAIDIDAANCEAVCLQGIATEVICGNFLSIEPPADPARRADVIIMNPPFATRADIAHVTHAFRWLRPGGILVAIMSPHWTFASGRAAQEFRDAIYGPPAHEATWEQLPDNTFRGEGTGVSAGILSLRKPA
jgi:predicted RNA methylase